MRLLVTVFLLGAVFIYPCGPFLPELEFTPAHGPLPGAERSFARGQSGVIRPHFYHEPLLLAYRQLSGVPMSVGEAAALFPAPHPAGQRGAAARWLEARQVRGAAKIDSIYANKRLPGSDYVEFPNCLDVAFETAVQTLQDRIARWGAASSNVAQWVAAQDQVFENCSKGPTIPTTTPAGSDPLLAADRQYQIAAAKFYAGQFDEAARDFEAIAGSADSPWRDAGRYLAARAMIRQGTLQNQPGKLRDAKTKLRAVLADPAEKRWHASAQGLIEFIHATLDPTGRMIELGNEIMRPAIGAEIRQAVTDYTHLWDRSEEAKYDVPADKSEVTDWIETFQSPGRNAHAVDRWRAVHSEPWLAAALVWAKPKDAAVPDLLAAARQIPPESPAYATVVYYGIRLQIQSGETDPARQWADAALATKQPDSVVNLLRAERLAVARDWTEFLRYTPRKPVALMYGGDIPDDPTAPRPASAFDLDSAGPMNRIVPLALWIEAASSGELPRRLQAEIAQAGWIRAVLLDDAMAARNLAARARELRPELAPAVKDYLAQTEPEAAKFTAVFWILRLPGLTPEIRAGIGRTTKVSEIDSFRDNWWWRSAAPSASAGDRDSNHQAIYDLYPAGDIGPDGFLPGDERTAGGKEAEQLRTTAPNAVTYLAAAAIAWARAHPQDPRVPEALHLAVRCTHYGGGADKTSTPLSKEAFDLLHRRYPNSDWAKKTKYWY
jgi:tetratricopeptide (TPR) repeat protein